MEINFWMLMAYIISLVFSIGWAFFDIIKELAGGQDISLAKFIGYFCLVLCPIVNTMIMWACIGIYAYDYFNDIKIFKGRR